MAELLLKTDHLSKDFMLGQISADTFWKDLRARRARRKGLETAPDPEIFHALRDVSFELRRGEAVGVIGRNGAGKSTLLKLISRITAPSSGEIRLRGRVASLLEIGTGFHPELTGRENVYLNGAILGMTRQETARKMDEIIAFSEIEKFMDTPVKRYSSGMYVKLAFAVAAHLESDILICDEVLAVGDTEFQKKCLGKMDDVASHGRAVLYVSHNMRTISQLCNRTICLEKGQLVFDGSVPKGIETYVGGIGGQVPNRDYTGHPRSMGMGDTARLLSSRVLGKSLNEFGPGETMHFQLSFTSSQPLANAYIRAVVGMNGDTPLGMSVMPDTVFVPENQPVTLELSLPLNVFSAGEYQIALSLEARTDTGSPIVLDQVRDAIRMSIADDPGKNHGMLWRENRWGNAHLPALERVQPARK